MASQMSKEVKDLPPSAKLVFFVLKEHESLTQKQLSEESLLPSRTVRYAISQLQEIDVIKTQVSFRDARQQIYSLSEAGTEVADSLS
jgi:DNA-binding MarR family transcriptional regulator